MNTSPLTALRATNSGAFILASTQVPNLPKSFQRQMNLA